MYKLYKIKCLLLDILYNIIMTKRLSNKYNNLGDKKKNIFFFLFI